MAVRRPGITPTKKNEIVCTRSMAGCKDKYYCNKNKLKHRQTFSIQVMKGKKKQNETENQSHHNAKDVVFSQYKKEYMRNISVMYTLYKQSINNII